MNKIDQMKVKEFCIMKQSGTLGVSCKGSVGQNFKHSENRSIPQHYPYAWCLISENAFKGSFKHKNTNCT